MSASGYRQLSLLLAPELVVALTGLLVLLLDLSLLRGATLARRFGVTTIVAVMGCLIALLLLVVLPTSGSLAGGMFVVTAITRLIQIALLVLSVLVLLLASSTRFTTHVGEYCGLLLFATIAMMLLVSTQNLLVLFLTIEFLSLSLYVLTAFDKHSRASTEAGLTYFLFGGMSAAFLLFGISLLYGLSGSLTLGPIAAALSRKPGDALLTPAIVMLLAGFGFKVAAAPFHMWAPEVYQGAPTPSSALIASSSKVASFFAFFVVFSLGLPAHGEWGTLIAWVAATSMVWGNLAAIPQTSVRRVLAYSAIGHAGYMLIALIVNTPQSLAALMYYVITYALTTIGAFAVISTLEGVDTIADFAGLSKRAPGVSFCLLIFLLSLAGVPPLAGFFGKFFLFVSAVDAEPRQIVLVVLALAMSVVSFYYYLRILKQVYVHDPVARGAQINVPAATQIALWVSALSVVILGCFPDWFVSRVAGAIAGSFH